MLGALQNRTCRLSITLARSKRWRNGEEVFPWRRQLNELSRNSPSGNPQMYTKPGNSDCTFRRRHALHTIYPREDGHNVSLVQMSSSLRHQATSRLPNAKSQVAPLIHSFTTSFFSFFFVTSRCPATSGSCNNRSCPPFAHKTYALRPALCFFFPDSHLTTH